MNIDPPTTITRTELKRRNRVVLAALVTAIAVPVVLIGLFGVHWATISVSIGIAWVCFALIIPANVTGVLRGPKVICEDAAASERSPNEKKA
jgi:hypothetical protein